MDDKWIKKKSKELKGADPVDLEVAGIFASIEHWVLRDGIREAEKRSTELNNHIDRLDKEQSSQVNSTLLALHLIRFWAENSKGPLAKQMLSKTTRAIDAVKANVIKESGFATSVFSYRCADDMLRIVEGRAVLPKEVRDKRISFFLNSDETIKKRKEDSGE